MAIYGSLDEVNIASVSSSVNDGNTAVAVFVYDTTKDSDGGAWRKRTQNTTWYNETLGTTTRGTRKEFPSVAIIVADQNKIRIYDGDDPDTPMWMVFNYNPNGGELINTNGNQITGLCALNGVFCWTAFRCGLINFIADSSELLEAGFSYSIKVGLVYRNSSGNYSVAPTGRQIVSNTVRGVDMTVLTHSSVDPKTGLPFPTIAVATDNGVSIINPPDQGTSSQIYDITRDGSIGGVNGVSFYGDKLFTFCNTVGTGTRNSYSYYAHIYSDTTSSSTSYRVARYVDATTSGGNLFYSDGAAAIYGHKGSYMGGTQFVAFSSDQHLCFIHEDSYNPDLGMVAYVDTAHNTGWLVGQCKAAVLTSCQAETLSNGTSDEDRSALSNNAIAVGTIVKSTVTGSDVVGYAVDGNSNYLEIPYASDLVNIGQNDFTVMGWFYNADTSTTFWDIADSASPRFFVSTRYGGTDRIWIYMQTSTGTLNWQYGSGVLNKTYWQHICVTRRNGILYACLNGERFESNNGSGSDGNMNSTTAPVTIGNNYTHGSGGDCEMAMWRFSRTAVTESQIRKIYDDEKGLFDGSGFATLYGTTNAVANNGQAIAFDKTTGLLHVGTASGRSDFSGLVRINNTTDQVQSCISAAKGIIVEE